MSCISSNFSSFFLNSLNDPSEFSKYLSNGELRFSSFEDFQVYNNSSASQQQYQQQQPQIYHMNGGGPTTSGDPLQQGGDEGNSNLENTHPTGQQHHHHMPHPHQQQPNHYIGGSYHPQNHGNGHPLMHLQQHQQRWTPGGNAGNPQQGLPPPSSQGASNGPVSVGGAPQHFDGSFEFMKYLRHSNDYNDNQHHPGHNSSASGSGGPTAIGTKPDPSLNANNASLIDLDTTPHKVSRSSRKTPANHHGASNANSSNHQPPTPMAVDVYDHDSKHMLYDLHHMNSVHSSNSNESSMELSSLTYPNSHLNASNSNTSSEGGNNHGGHSDFSMLGVAGGGSGTTASSGGVSSSANGGTDAAANASPAVPKVLANFSITENFEAHPSHKVEEGIFQHMNKLPGKKKDNLKSLGVRFTGQMTLNDKMIIVDNFIRFCQEYDIQDHRPFLSLNQSGLNKPDQIKFARYLGQGLPTFTLFCIYSNFKNLFCTKRTEIYTKDGYNLPYILEKTKSFLANTAADLKNIINQQSNDSMDFVATTSAASTTGGPSSATAVSVPNANSSSSSISNLPPPLVPAQLTQTGSGLNPMLMDYNNHSNNNVMMPPTSTTVPTAAGASQSLIVGGGVATAVTPSRPLENLMIFDNFDVHETHRIEDGFCTQLSRLPPKKQELLKQFGIQTNQTVTYYEKYILIENFNRFCNEYKVADHRPFLDLSESGLPKSEQLKFIRYLGQGLPNLTLNKIYLVFKDILGLSRIEKMAIEGYNLDAILKKKKRNLYNRMTAAAVHKECNPDAPTPAIPPALTQAAKPVIPTKSNVTTAKATTSSLPVPAPTSVYQTEAYKT
ncbi:uncharacterized protein LOC142234624 isoform X2 [Haematobia irritans]|uniref:uncharacterized protein LOC142234624 isoform X2 n=1 Tax=Haematobia irritans TaxID=7368 RepID=UPI003F501E0E